MFVFPRHLGDHGYLIEGAVTLPKEILDKSIPYKYWVSCEKGEYEFIYKKPVSKTPVNRCLLIQKRFLNLSGGELCWLGGDPCCPMAQNSCQTALSEAGSSVGSWKREGTSLQWLFPCVAVPEWHQYDDIVCAKPSALQNFWQKIAGDKNKEVAEGKKIAASVMLESIFSILGTWSPGNLSNFFWQLKQFCDVVGAQRVFEGKPEVWRELDFSTEQVTPSLAQRQKTLSR